METIYVLRKELFFKPEGSTLLGTLFTRLISNTTSKKMKFSIMDSVCRIYLRKEKENVWFIKKQNNWSYNWAMRNTGWNIFP